MSQLSRETGECKTTIGVKQTYSEKIPSIVDELISQCGGGRCGTGPCDPNQKDVGSCFSHIDFEPIPSKESVITIIDTLKEVIFPGYFNRERLDPINMRYHLGRATTHLFDLLAEQICHSIRHDCIRYDQACQRCEDQGYELSTEFIKTLPSLRRAMAKDVQATLDGDPAAKSADEIIFSYPGVFAVFVYRAAHELFHLNVPLLPRIMTEYAHTITGIDIHPGAHIGERFVIDHGTGVVVGETTVIGDNVRIYQGVTLGALSLPPDAGERLRGRKRHPTIEEDVIIYSGATILGGDTVIGAGSVIGGNVWLTQSVPPDTTVLLEKPRLVFKQHRNGSPTIRKESSHADL
jgi:serine O-acetyltransferase